MFHLSKLFSRNQKPERTVFLHIGQHKTGTSAIQQMLSDNRDTLRQLGYIYPILTGPASHELARYFGFGNQTALSEFQQRKSPQEHEKFIRERIFLQRNRKDNIIISSESFSFINNLHNYQKLIELKRFFTSWNIKIIYYVRRQDSFIESAFNQKLKTGSEKTSLLYRVENQNLDWYYLLSCYSKVFGKENIIVRVYEKSSFAKYGLFHDFLNAIGVNDRNDFIFPEKDKNKKFNQNIMALIKLCPSANSMQMVSLFQKVEKNNPYDHYLLSPKERIAVIEKYDKSNQKIAAEFLQKSDGKLFNEPWPEPDEEWEPFEGLTLEKSIPVLMELLVKQSASLIKLTNELDKLKE